LSTPTATPGLTHGVLPAPDREGLAACGSAASLAPPNATPAASPTEATILPSLTATASSPPVATTTPQPAPVKTTPRPPAKTAPRPPAKSGPPPATTTGCYPVSNEGTCYRPGEFCRNSDHGMTADRGRRGDHLYLQRRLALGSCVISRPAPRNPRRHIPHIAHRKDPCNLDRGTSTWPWPTPPGGQQGTQPEPQAGRVRAWSAWRTA
jgi:hypothetical protein